MATYPDQLAHGITGQGSFDPFHLFAGESEIVTDQAQATATAIDQFVPVGRVTASGLVKAWDPAASDGSEQIVGVTAQPFLSGGKGPIYVKAIFNHEALKWPVAIDTLAERKAALDGTGIGVRQLL